MTAVRWEGEPRETTVTPPHLRVQGPASTRNQVRSIDLRVDALPDGKLRLSTPMARGWARVVSSRDELNRAVAEAFTEIQLASYARWRGQAYDHDAMSPAWGDDPDPLVAAGPVGRRHRRGRSDIHDPRDWCPLDDGRWRSPSGRVFGPDTDAVRRVRLKRQQAGLSD